MSEDTRAAIEATTGEDGVVTRTERLRLSQDRWHCARNVVNTDVCNISVKAECGAEGRVDSR